ncbi:predicted protein [Arabidopsis lyrata subsp. lyrata]|uniref:Predicted protein n=1 Tax=Arabidopsis lyrata subsp. lyrata TaxID=81972 RepID=D7KCB6_ARALL|nr:predicted protein [Arabidopsis lyrata subsp. lyrata]
MAQHQHSPQRLRDQENTRPHELYGDVFSVSGDDDVARKQGVSFSQPDPTVATMGSADTVTIGEALEATALSLGDKPVDHKDAAAIQAAETRATGESMARPGGLARERLWDLEINVVDAAEKLPGDKVVTSEDAEAVVGAELRSSSEMKTTPGGVADSMSAGARLNQQL